uniref:Fructose-bisphosphate aldolase n=1 Tax=Pseudodiaptomus poplesia TaxID=213370 RepID=A0A0U2VC80_9MAXI|nr:fructose-bisphosphate aldolase [Pseudodiaptomus poplesia]
MSSTKYEDLPDELQVELRNIASSICRKGCGILAADETPLAMADRFNHLNIENSPENRRKYRQMLFSCTRDELAPLSAVILQDETVHQTTDDGRPFAQVVSDLGIVPGITLDKGWIKMTGSSKEVYTQGLDGLDQRCVEYKKLGCQFAKWRMVVSIGDDIPTTEAIKEGARSMAMYAMITQRNGLVPIIEPDIGRGGSHTAERCLKVTQVVLAEVYKALADYHIYLEGTLLKPNMVTNGNKCPVHADPERVAELTLIALSRHVPPAVPGVFFLSWGQTEKMATDNLRAINNTDGIPKPWMTSFCYGRALQDSCRSAWLGKDENMTEAKLQFIQRVAENGLAAIGQKTTQTDK